MPVGNRHCAAKSAFGACHTIVRMTSATAAYDDDPATRLPPRQRLLSAIPGTVAAGWLGPLAVTLFAFLLRLHRLAVPAKVAFDETYYACDGFSLLKYGYEHSHGENCAFEGGAAFIVHPPLGKWLIALGEWRWDYTSFGWRISACVFGSLSVLVLCRLGRRMFRSTLLGCLAGFLLALDGLHFVQSRVAMLDIFIMFFVVAALACLVADRDQLRARLADAVGGDLSYPGPKIGFRWWRLAAGVCLGLALATKWSAIYYLAAFGLLALGWEIGARRTAGVPSPFRASLWREAGPLFLTLLAVPVVLYVLSWSGWFLTDGGWRRACGTRWTTDCGPVAGWFKYHSEMWKFHSNLDAAHPYASKPFGWLLLARPVSYFYSAPVEGTAKEILAIGTPAIWWASILALIATLTRWFSRRDWRAATILVGFAAGYLPWFATPDRTEFFFYALPSLPFMCLALAYCAGLLIGPWGAPEGRRQTAAILIGTYVALVAVNFFFFYPVLSAEVIPSSSWRDRIWFSSWI